jgi:5-hydroxyisourate hydrolase
MSRSPITTHVLDTGRGAPAAGVPVRLEYKGREGGWVLIAQEVTDADGRLIQWLPAAFELVAGYYRLLFDTSTYARATNQDTFYPYAHIAFEVKDTRAHYHVPLLLSPFGYSTYRGS